MRAVLAQIVSGPDPESNLALVRRETALAAEAGADLVVFPEATMCCFGVPLAGVAEPIDGRWAAGVRQVAQDHDVVVVAGMFTPADEGRVTNTLLATGRGVEAAYAKIHLYDAFGFTESATVAPGHELVLIEIAGERVGLSTCYDVRFPELYIGLAERGASTIVVAASWGAGPGKIEQWDLLTRARALDATVHLLAVGQADPRSVGRQPGSAPTGVGHSRAVGPDGMMFAELGAAPGRLAVVTDHRRVAQTRRVLPVLNNRRVSLGPAAADARPVDRLAP